MISIMTLLDSKDNFIYYLWYSLVNSILGVSALLTNQLGIIIMDIKTEREDNNVENHYRDTKDKVAFNELKILLLDILLPLLDILVDIAKAVVLVFEGQQIENYQRFSQHFLQTAVYGVISVMLKWCPVVVAALHFQDMNRCRCPQRL